MPSRTDLGDFTINWEMYNVTSTFFSEKISIVLRYYITLSMPEVEKVCFLFKILQNDSG
jgi:hypothetical protein